MKRLRASLILPLAANLFGSGSTAWQDGRFHVDVPDVVSRSNIVLQKSNRTREEALPLGNGRLGVAVWSEGGLRLQLNRADTLPARLSPGQVLLPGLEKLVDAPDYAGGLDLYRSEFHEHGGGLTASVYVQSDSDAAVIQVTGADPNSLQTAKLYLWQPRAAKAAVRKGFALLSETWKDSSEAGASGETFGSLAAISADARDLQTAVTAPDEVTLSFRPKADGSFRVLITAPAWTGGDAVNASGKMLAHAKGVSVAEHQLWWKAFWEHTGLMKMTSQDGSAEYFENLRCIDLYTAAAESLGPLPGSQAGIGDLFSSMRDEHKWGPSAYWHWNLRMQVAANLGAGLFRFNDSYFNLYRSNLDNIEAWTKAQMANRAGVCVPETMRFNGKGYENETWLSEPGLNCSANYKPYYNARTLSTGAEVGLWVWQQYLATRDQGFLVRNYPLMSESARFLLAYAAPGPDGKLHTYPTNAHETQWDVHDSTTDIAAMSTLFPAVVKAARILNLDAELTHALELAIPRIPAFARTTGDSIAQSYDQNAEVRNSENIGLEVVWPYSLIGDAGPLHDVGVRTYAVRPNKFDDDWSFDPIQAARLGLADQMKTGLLNLTDKYQAYPSGLGKFMGSEFYVEQIGVVAAALQEALVQDYDGVVRVAPAWPKDWDVDGTVYIQQKSKIDVQMRAGRPVTVVIESGSSGQMRLRNPWPGKPVEVVVNGKPVKVNEDSDTQVLEVPITEGKSYLLQLEEMHNNQTTFAEVDGTAAIHPKSLGSRHIGIP